MDFTIRQYEKLLLTLLKTNYTITSFANYCEKKEQLHKVIILRQDVDRNPQNSLRIAILQANLGIKSTFYFRIARQSFNEQIIKKITNLGHEIGYHYEDISICKGNAEKAIEHFRKQLNKLRQIYPVKTICMHGSPLSPWDNRLLWKKYNFRDLGIIGDPFMDLDFNKVFYLTDTGRRWNGTNYSIRDKVDNPFNFNFITTKEIIKAFELKGLPEKIMINIHPQRWNDNLFHWLYELYMQKLKNQIKKIIIKKYLLKNVN